MFIAAVAAAAAVAGVLRAVTKRRIKKNNVAYIQLCEGLLHLNFLLGVKSYIFLLYFSCYLSPDSLHTFN